MASTKNLVIAGVLLMLLGDFMFTLNDTMGKWLVATFSVGQVLLVRSIGAFLVLGPMVVRAGPASLFRVERPGLQVLRVVLTTVETAIFYLGVMYLPLADFLSFYMAGPIYVTALSPFLLGEKVGWRRWTAVLVGFAGVLIILNPSPAAMSWPSLYAFAGSLLFGGIIVLGRMLRGTSDTTLVTWQTLGCLVLGAVLAVGAWTPPTPVDFVALLMLGIVACVAHMLITRALKMAPASTLAPLHYSLLLWGIVLGYLVFGDLPEPRVLVGAAVVTLAGLFILHRERTRPDMPVETVAGAVN